MYIYMYICIYIGVYIHIYHPWHTGEIDVCFNWPRDKHDFAVRKCLRYEQLQRRDTTHLMVFDTKGLRHHSALQSS